MLGVVATLTAAVCWAFSSTIYKTVLAGSGPRTLNLVRSVTVTLYAVVLLFWLGEPGLVQQLDLISLSYIGVSALLALVIGDTFYFLGIRSLGVSRAVPIAYTFPLFLSPMAILFLGEAFSELVIVGTVVVVAGVWLVASTRPSGTKTDSPKRGVMLTLGTSLCWACAFVFMKLVLVEHEPLVMNLVRMFFVLPIMTVFRVVPMRSLPEPRPNRARFLMMGAGGLLGIGIGDTLLFVGLQNTGAQIVGPLSATAPLFAGLFGVLILKEQVSGRLISGILCTVAGVALLTFPY